MHSHRKTIGYLLLLMLTTIPAWAPLTRPGLPAWRPGALPALSLTSGPLEPAQWPARFLLAAGLNSVAAVKVSLVLAFVLLALVLFFWARSLWGEKAGVLAVLLALYTPVLLNAIYIQGVLAAIWVMLGAGLLGWGLEMRRWRRWSAFFMGIVLIGPNVPFLIHTSLMLPAVSFSQFFEPAWFWDVVSINLQTPMAWTPGLPLLALAFIAAWLAFMTPSRRDDRKDGVSPLRTLPALLVLGIFFLIDALVTSDHTLALIFVLTATLPLAVAAAGLLELAPLLQTPGLWAALLLLPVLGVGPTLSPDFVTVPIPEQPAAIFGDQQIMLIDVSIDGELTPGQTVTVDAVWQALQPIDFDYNIFIHVTDDAGNTVAQFDGQPRDGHRPMTTWLPGEIISDAYQIDIPADAPASLHLRMGLYNWQTLERLPLASGGDSLTLP